MLGIGSSSSASIVPCEGARLVETGGAGATVISGEGDAAEGGNNVAFEREGKYSWDTGIAPELGWLP